MGKDEKEDSGFGFKDRAKAEETLRLLERHEPNYRRLTVRGLLGRARRVLSLTKAEEKIKNIKEAMEVFETWLAELDLNKEKKLEKEKKPEKEKKKEERKMSTSDQSGSESELPPTSVPGLGYRDAGAARAAVRALEGRDPDYCRLAAAGLLAAARRGLAGTRDETKQANIKEAISILEEYAERPLPRARPYLGAAPARAAHARAAALTQLQRDFLSAYISVRGEYKRLRNVKATGSDVTWDIVRNQHLAELVEKHANAKLFNEKDEPTPEHLELIAWAYSPEADKLNKVLKETEEDKKSKDGDKNSKDEDEKNNDVDEDSEGEKKEEKKERRDRKRQRSSDSGEESPSKKTKE